VNKLVEYIAEVEGVGVSSRNNEVFIEDEGSWKKIGSAKLKSYQNGYKSWLADKRKEGIENSLMTLADSKQEDAERLIFGYKATPKQIERYKDKYERAMAGEFDDATNVVIIQKFEAMRLSIRQFTDMIEDYRGLVDDLIQSGELDKAENAIVAGKSFGATTTKADVSKVFEGL